MVENDDPMATNKDVDNIQIRKLLLISYFLKTFKQVVIILNVSYFLGILWWILCEIEEDFIIGLDFSELDEDYVAKYYSGYFLTDY